MSKIMVPMGILLIMLGSQSSSAQPIFHRGFSIGSQIGYSLVSDDPKLAKHVAYGGLLEYAGSRSWCLRGYLEYFEAASYWNPRTFDYMDKRYIVRDGRLWQNYSLHLVLLRSIWKNFWLGGGLSGHNIRIKEQINLWRFPFYWDENEILRVIPHEESKASLYRTGVLGVTELRVPLNSRFAFFLEAQLKWILVGKKYGYKMDSQILVSGLGGVIIKVK